MTFRETALPGVLLVCADVFPDSRGSFERSWEAREVAERGLETTVAQCSVARNRWRGTIRGLHYQQAPGEEAKFIRVIRGAIYDVAVDMREDSPTRYQWVGVELHDGGAAMLYVPRGFAHGYQTLTDDAEVLYFVSAAYSPPLQRGVRWDDPTIGVDWPLGAPTTISERDAALPHVARVR